MLATTLSARDQLHHSIDTSGALLGKGSREQIWAHKKAGKKYRLWNDPKGIRTPVARMKTWSPRPLDDGAGHS